jgi:hypothetical protein
MNFLSLFKVIKDNTAKGLDRTFYNGYQPKCESNCKIPPNTWSNSVKPDYVQPASVALRNEISIPYTDYIDFLTEYNELKAKCAQYEAILEKLCATTDRYNDVYVDDFETGSPNYQCKSHVKVKVRRKVKSGCHKNYETDSFEGFNHV